MGESRSGCWRRGGYRRRDRGGLGRLQVTAFCCWQGRTRNEKGLCFFCPSRWWKSTAAVGRAADAPRSTQCRRPTSSSAWCRRRRRRRWLAAARLAQLCTSGGHLAVVIVTYNHGSQTGADGAVSTRWTRVGRGLLARRQALISAAAASRTSLPPPVPATATTISPFSPLLPTPPFARSPHVPNQKAKFAHS